MSLRGQIILIGTALISLKAGALPNKCTKTIVQAILAGLESPCGTPRATSKRNVIEFTYSDDGWNGPMYSPLENCGFETPSGLGNLRIKIKPRANGDCTIVSMKDWPREIYSDGNERLESYP